MSSDPASLASPLIWLKIEIDRSLGVAREALAQGVGEADNRATNLHSCESQVRHVRGAVYIMGLEGAARYCQALEGAVRRCAESAAKLSHVTAAIIDRSMFALSQFLDDVSKGEMDIPLKLFPLYRELSELAGRSDSDIFEIELFYPDLTMVPPAHPASKKLASADVPKYIVACRAHYQRYLQTWLNESGDAQALHGMRTALDALDQVAPQLGTPAGLWWAAVGFVEAVIQQDARVLDLPIKAVFSRIDELLAGISSGANVDCAGPMREILYPLALSAPVSRRVRDAKNLFQLDQQLPEFCVSGTLEYDLAGMAPALDGMRRRLTGVEEAWVLYTSGGKDGLLRLRDETNALKEIARDLGFYHLVRLLEVIVLIVSKLPESHPSNNEVLALEMAAALLFMERMLDQFVSPPPDIDQQVAVMVGWLLDAVKPRGQGASASGGPRDDITQRQSYAQVRAQVAREILENLRQVEQLIDAIARDPKTREGIVGLDVPVRQIAGALKMLGLSRANGLLSACQHLMKLSISGDVSLTYASLEWVADGLSCLGFYLDALHRGEQPSEDILIGFLHRLGREDSRPAGSTGWVAAGAESGDDYSPARVDESSAPAEAPPMPLPSVSGTVDGGTVETEPSNELTTEEEPSERALRDSNSHELRAVYVEEAQQVLASIAPALERLGGAPSDQHVLDEVRRAFHTLKGSGRLVGLDALGNLAGEIEQAVDLCLDLAQPAGSNLLDLISEVSLALLDATQDIEAGDLPDCSGFAEITAHAETLRAEINEAAARQARSAASPGLASDPGAAAAGAVVIGDVKLSGTLYQIYLRESGTHLATLDAELTRCECEPAHRVSASLVRSAHTLKSGSRTTGFTVVADLADALEQCLQHFEGEVLGPTALEAIWNARDAMSAMLTDIGQRRPPPPAPAQLNCLNEIAAAAPPIVKKAEAPEELDTHLTPVFLEEAGQLLPQIASDLKQWRTAPAEIQSARSKAAPAWPVLCVSVS